MAVSSNSNYLIISHSKYVYFLYICPFCNQCECDVMTGKPTERCFWFPVMQRTDLPPWHVIQAFSNLASTYTLTHVSQPFFPALSSHHTSMIHYLNTPCSFESPHLGSHCTLPLLGTSFERFYQNIV